MRRDADGWYVTCSCADVPTQPLPLPGEETGVDVGLTVVLVTAGGEISENPRHYRKAEQHLAQAGRRVSRRSRRKQGSKRRNKAVALLKRTHQQVQRQRCAFQQVQRQRCAFQHKTARALLRTYDTVSLEDLRVANLVRNRHLAKSIADAGWAQFCTLRACKAARAGKRVVLVDPTSTSQECSRCGERVPKRVRVRTHVCSSGGLVLDRDANAALNILRAGRARQASTWPAGASVA